MPGLADLNMSLKETLGTAYADAWVVDGQLHVAVTDESVFETVSAAGAVPVQAAFSAADLQEAGRRVQAAAAATGAELHRISSSGQSGIVAYVPAGAVESLRAALAETEIPGKVPVAVAPSSGVATPLESKSS